MIAKINKRTVSISIIVLLIFTLGALTGYFALKFSKLSLQFKNRQDEYGKLAKEKNELQENYSKLEGNYKKIEREFKDMSQDRENLINEIKGLIADRNRLKEVEGSLGVVKKDRERFVKESQEALENNLILKEKIKHLQDFQKQLLNEKEQLTKTLETERAKSFLLNLQQAKESLQKENNDLINKLKQSQSEYLRLNESSSKNKEELDKTIKDANELRERLNRLNDNYAKAVIKNKALEQQLMETPKKFAEIARQNKVLISQTANMHYNLGVFYTKQKEYTRALAEFEKALELTPNDAYVHFNLGYIYAEHLANRQKAIEHFRQYLRFVKKDDKDIDWVKKYIITWETWQGKKPIE